VPSWSPIIAKGASVFGPQSVPVLLLLVAMFVGLAYGLARPGMLALRIGSGTLAFVIASVFGMALVNRFYDYYQSWGDIYSDLSGHQPGVEALPPMGGKNLQASGNRAKVGLLVSTQLVGTRSDIDRDGLVYLPPQYFQVRYSHANFPVLELFHGAPGQPSDWQTGLHTTETLRKLLTKNKAQPTILVMPNINGSMGGETGSQCLNQPGGQQNDTYLSEDVPTDIVTSFRAQPIGAHWGVAGFSEGGFCAANLALRHPGVFSLAGVMSGYFSPLPELGGDPFHGDAQARLANDPIWQITQGQAGERLPAFWLMAGDADRSDVQDAKLFKSVLAAHGQTAPLITTPRAGHTFAAWTPALPKLLTWATDRLGPPAIPPPAFTTPTPHPTR
jgi:S-formylglutathione hydrolase FrmB